MGPSRMLPWRGQTRQMLTKPFYMGLFEVTQRQWELVTGENSSSRKGETRPVDRVSYDMIRGNEKGAKWPASGDVDWLVK